MITMTRTAIVIALCLVVVACATVPTYLANRPKGYHHTPLHELQTVEFREMGFMVDLPARHSPARPSDIKISPGTSEVYYSNAGYRNVFAMGHWEYPEVIDDAGYMLAVRFIALAKKDRSLFLAGKSYANGERITDNTNGFCFGTNVYEQMLDDRMYHGCTRFTWFRRDIEVANGDIIVGTVRLGWYDKNEKYRQSDSIAIRNILLSMRPIEQQEYPSEK